MYVSVFDIKKVGVIFKNKVERVILPSAEGEMTVLDFHQSFVCTLRKGVIRIDSSGINIKSGIAGMEDNEIRVFVELI